MKLKKIIALSAAVLLSLTGVNVPEKKSVNSAESTFQDVWFNNIYPSINGGEPIRGADVSSIISIEQAGVKFYNEDGQEDDLFRILAEHGVNYIRVRIWNEPYDSQGRGYGGGNSDLEKAKEIARRAAKYNMKLLVDIHYSDFWADPSRQTRPKYWAQHDHNTLKGEIYKWTSWVVESIDKAGGNIGMVQVGNETSCLFCGEDDMYKICDLFSSANKAIREYDKNILIAHHFPNPASGHYDWYAKVMDECKLDYDVFATSYYPYWHGSLDNLTSVLKGISQKYNKYVMVAETAYPYTNDDCDSYKNDVTSSGTNITLNYDVSVEGQKQCLTDVFKAVANVGSKGIGVFYWEPAWLGVYGLSLDEQKKLWNEYGSGWCSDYAVGYDKNVTAVGGSGFDNQALFDFYGKPLESLDVFEHIYPRKENNVPKLGAVVPEGKYRLKNLESGLYLTVADGEGKAGGNVFQYSANGAADYNTWQLVDAGDGYYRLYSGLGNGSTYLLDLDAGKADDKTNIGIYTDTKSDAQLFKFIKGDDKSYKIVTKSSGDKSAVEIANADKNDGANVQQFKLNGAGCQEWVLEPVEDYLLSGDMDGDGVIDSFDLLLLRRCLISQSKNEHGDINGDDSVNMADMVQLSRFLLGHKDVKLHQHGTPRNTIFPKSR